MTRRARGEGSVYQPTYKGRDGKLRKARLWWIGYTVRGRWLREPTHTKDKGEAARILRERLDEIGKGLPVGPSVETTTLADLVTLLKNDYKANRRRSLKRAVLSASHLTKCLGAATPAKGIGEAAVSAYVALRREEGAAAASINRELSALRRMLRLGRRMGRVGRVPDFDLLDEDNARQGFFERKQLDAILAKLPADVRPIIEVAYETGWRVTSEVLTRQWRHVDLKAGWLRLEPGEAKNREGRMFPLTPRLRRVLEAQRKRVPLLVPWVFARPPFKHRGKPGAGWRPIRVFGKPWKAACKAVGLPGKLVHDFRRTAVRNLIRAGVAQRVAMSMVGMRTDSIFRRYAIVDETMLREAGEKLGRASL